ncbi:ComEA family DNA-binding protein [Streptomyces panacea]|uniref:ComEA family DNA-binding protein n=1 Tax=Streptomyces panacea TaxID=3035064 RepID=UPI00339C6EB3
MVAPGAGEQPGGRRERVWVAVRERLPLWVQLRCGLEPKTLAALVVVLVVAVVLAVQHFWSGRPQSVSAPETVREAAAATGPARDPVPPSGTSGPSSAGASPAGRVVVDVSGKVRSPGVRRLPTGSRVTDALRAAGGAEPGADLTGLNRARVLVDGEQVVVGGPAPPGQVAAAPGTGVAGPEGAPVSLGTATVEQLDTLPGVGPVLARHIIDYRTQHGGFSSVDQLREVNGIGERRFADIEPRVRL